MLKRTILVILLLAVLLAINIYSPEVGIPADILLLVMRLLKGAI